MFSISKDNKRIEKWEFYKLLKARELIIELIRSYKPVWHYLAKHVLWAIINCKFWAYKKQVDVVNVIHSMMFSLVPINVINNNGLRTLFLICVEQSVGPTFRIHDGWY
jgi:hypothetical protein